jgi:hypothetical protein
LSALVIALCAFQGNAATQKVTLGSANLADLPLNMVSMSPAAPADPLNPNLFPVFFAETAIGAYGFLLDGSEWANSLVKRFENARATGTNITIYYDDASSFITLHTAWNLNGTAPARKIVYISTDRVN